MSRKGKTFEEEIEFLKWLMNHTYKEAPQHFKISEGAARAWANRIRRKYRKERLHINEITTLMRISPRIRKIMLSGNVPKDND